MRRIAIGLLALAAVLGGFALWDLIRTSPGTSPEPKAWAHYSDRDFGWSVTYPVRFQLRPIEDDGDSRVTVDGFRVSNVRLAGVIRTSDLPPSAVALSLVHTVGGPAPRPVGRDTRLPLPDTRFQPRGKRQHRRVEIAANGLAFWGDVWIGPEASRADRIALRRIVRSLRFDPPPGAVATR
jgi:hypothetical protein